MSRYYKFLAAALTAASTAFVAAVEDGTISGDEWRLILLAAVGSVAVYFVPNKPPAGQMSNPRYSEQG